ncbi:uncharacterized protein CANTADRAFT_22047 [Suhomyces tanzawaensis NRRL Y-17324]|uniref:Uncharacterized protein n=1 Tax=Suhomyces tanzawaensis NRRL Y-17324 TaxID=984487 RepID=A0A1E4SIM7_9ASCO|nr:uncharacterized protein CANTADRAFT_22047 [Suhomyces tanzawaensis NRRL Y-17324]ODV79297.1 hypothetical protein CANTADRAFT_22047 [Suhomyces tanzawaensis NRRL Y-17324]
MAKSRRNDGFAKSKQFEQLNPDIEDEILEVYAQLTAESPDLFLHQLPEFFTFLKVPHCFIYDILQCTEYYYEFMQRDKLVVDARNVKQQTTINLLQAYTITGSDSDLIDIVDIDKLIRHGNKLVKFRNNYHHIYESWKLFVQAASDSTSKSAIVHYKLSLPDLKRIKAVLNLDESEGRTSFSDSLLIDMLSCCSTDSDGNIINFDFDKPKEGSYLSIKDFAEILGNLGELE